MRLEIIIPDSTPAARIAKLADLTHQLSARPELVDVIDLGEPTDDESIQKLFTPERLALIEAADADISAGNGLTLDQLDARLAANRKAWQAANQG